MTLHAWFISADPFSCDASDYQVCCISVSNLSRDNCIVILKKIDVELFVKIFVSRSLEPKNVVKKYVSMCTYIVNV